MKVSVLLPSLYPYLADRLIRQIRTSRKPEGVEVEIVICSPVQTFGEGIVWVEEKKPRGNNPAMRSAFLASSGDLICSLADDFGVSDNWLEASLPQLNGQEELMVAMDGGAFSVFGYRYAISQLTTRGTVNRHWQYFFPYVSHWGDPAFALDLWRSGGRVIGMPGVVHWGLDRMGCGESRLKESTFESDKVAFLRDFGSMGAGYDLAGDWHRYNGVYPCKYDK